MINVDNRLLFAIPKKGRLFEQCMDYLKRIGLSFRKRDRHDIALCTNMDIAVVFLPADDIPLYIGSGRVDIGITGEDMVHEADMENEVNVLLKLGFGQCTLSLAVPKDSGLKPEKFSGKSVVTSFPHLTRKYFEKINTANVKVKEVSGSVEIACAMGAADGITDLVQTGDTIREAGLEVIAEIFPTEAVLLAKKNSRYENLIQVLKERMQGVIYADEYALIEYNVSRENLPVCEKITPGLKSPTIMPLEEDGWVAVKSVIKKKNANQIMDDLKAAGANGILVTSMQHCRV